MYVCMYVDTSQVTFRSQTCQQYVCNKYRGQIVCWPLFIYSYDTLVCPLVFWWGWLDVEWTDEELIGRTQAFGLLGKKKRQ